MTGVAFDSPDSGHRSPSGMKYRVRGVLVETRAGRHPGAAPRRPAARRSPAHRPGPLHLAEVFGLDEKTAMRYADSARALLHHGAEQQLR
ncbi:hypothetical protein [Streptomyces sp. NPDC058595]|uniref:hypothetical protein n=1 Tax=Streptomyces sp. NPDC058595 TaxID=3346550 RepID=UPI00365A28CE